MGRPLNKRWFNANSLNNIKVQFNNGTSSVRGYIVKQLGTKKFLCSDSDGNRAICRLKLKDSADLNAGEMSITVKYDDNTVRHVYKIASRRISVNPATNNNTTSGMSTSGWTFATSTTDGKWQIEEAGTDTYFTSAKDFEGDDPVIPAGMDRNEPLPGSGTLAAIGTFVGSYSSSGMTYRNISASALDSITNSTAGLYRRKYVGNFSTTYLKDVSYDFNVNFMKTPANGPISTADHEIDETVSFSRLDLTDENNYAFEWKGYIQAPATGNFNFFSSVDDDCVVWIGAPATASTLGKTASDFLFAQTGGTRNASTEGIAMTANKWYPIRIWFQEWAGAEKFQLGANCSANSTKYGSGSGAVPFNFAHNASTKGY